MINPKKETTINITVKVSNDLVTSLEVYLNYWFNLIDYSVIKDTSAMYDQDATFKKIVKEAKKIKDIRLKYINDNNYKYEK